jgi:hypothetical protein
MELPYQLSPSLHKDDCTDARGECLSKKTTLKMLKFKGKD